MELVSALKNGEPHAAAWLFDSYGSIIYGLVVKEAKTVLDNYAKLFCDAFRAIVNSIHHFDERKMKFSTWIYQQVMKIIRSWKQAFQ
jgi:hypothetical protein